MTWFVDPPYLVKGTWYKHHAIDYNELADWCKSRLGQVMVCENTNAKWLDFKPLVDIPFTHFKNGNDYHKKTTEGIWLSE